MWYFFTRLENRLGSTERKVKIPKDVRDLQRLFRIVEKGKSTWEATFDAIRDPVMIIDETYRVERANMEAAERSGVEVKKMIGQHCYEVFAGRQAICPRCPLEVTLKRQRPQVVEIEKLKKEADFQVNSYPLAFGEGPRRVVHHYRDVTDERLLQRKLVQSEKMAAIGMLAGGVAHEINNPLGGILAFAQLIRQELPLESPLQNDVKEIQEAAKRCKKIVEDLLSFSRPSADLEKSPQDLNQLVEKILPLLRLKFREGSITVRTEYGTSLPPVWGDANRLQQVFLNLLQNAGESMKGGGTVTIRTRRAPAGSEVVLEVADQGMGIAPEDVERIFEPFFTTKGLRGTGLGLSICDSIIQDHRGRIDVESERGKGSLFRVVLPAWEKGGGSP